MGAGSPDALASALVKLVADPELRKSLGQAGRDRALTDFSIDRMIDEFVQAYKEVAVSVLTSSAGK